MKEEEAVEGEASSGDIRAGGNLRHGASRRDASLISRPGTDRASDPDAGRLMMSDPDTGRLMSSWTLR